MWLDAVAIAAVAGDACWDQAAASAWRLDYCRLLVSQRCIQCKSSHTPNLTSWFVEICCRYCRSSCALSQRRLTAALSPRCSSLRRLRWTHTPSAPALAPPTADSARADRRHANGPCLSVGASAGVHPCNRGVLRTRLRFRGATPLMNSWDQARSHPSPASPLRWPSCCCRCCNRRQHGHRV